MFLQTDTRLKFTETNLYHGYAFIIVFTMSLQWGNHREIKYVVFTDWNLMETTWNNIMVYALRKQYIKYQRRILARLLIHVGSFCWIWIFHQVVGIKIINSIVPVARGFASQGVDTIVYIFSLNVWFMSLRFRLKNKAWIHLWNSLTGLSKV